MNSIQVADETFVAASGEQVGAVVGDPSSWRRWWPDLQLQVVEDRADKGVRWTVGGPLTGTMEIWLEPMLDGVLLHYFLHAEPTGVTGRQLARLNLAKLNHRRRVAASGWPSRSRTAWSVPGRSGSRRSPCIDPVPPVAAR